jgi:hypothetical protein
MLRLVFNTGNKELINTEESLFPVAASSSNLPLTVEVEFSAVSPNGSSFA